MKYSARHYLRLFFSAILFALILAGCGEDTEGGTGSGGGSSGGGAGSVALLMTDATTEEFSEILITVTSVELISESQKVTIFSGTRTFDLLKLEDESRLFSISPRVPSLWYNKIRLHVLDIELVKKDGTIIHPKRPGGGKLDLNPRGQFHVMAGETLILQVDIDAEKSIHIVKTGSDEIYIFRPVVFIDILNTFTSGKLARLHGFVRNIDAASMTFSLCPNAETEHADSSVHKEYINTDNHVTRCIPVHNTSTTSYFDSSGDPIRFTALSEGLFVTAIGHLRIIPIILEGGGIDPLGVGLEAILIEVGDFLRLKGIIESLPGVLTNRFDFLLADDQGFPTGTSIEVELQRGTKIFSRRGVELTKADIEVGLRAKIDGVLVLSEIDPDYLKAALVLLRSDAYLGAEKIEGLISSIDPPAMSLSLFDPDSSTTTCVELTEYTSVFLITDTPTGYTCEEIDIWSLNLRQNVKIFGYYDSSGCFVADTIVAFPL